MTTQVTEVYVEWCLNFNGVAILLEGDDDPSEAQYKLFDKASITLPGLTYDIVGGDVFDDIAEGNMDCDDIAVSDEDKAKIIAAAQSILGDDYKVTSLSYNTTDT